MFAQEDDVSRVIGRLGGEGGEGGEIGDDLGPIELQPQHHAGLEATSVEMVQAIGRNLGRRVDDLPADLVSEAVEVLHEYRVAVAASGRFRPADAARVGRDVRRILAR